MLLWRKNRKAKQKRMSDVTEQISRAKTDETALEALIREHKQFILANAYRTSGRFTTESDDAYSIALIAFHEAVKAYEPEKGDFHAFASLVMKRRLLDWMKTEGRHAGEIDVSPEILDGTVEDDTAQSAISLAVHRKEAELAKEASDDATPGSSAMRDEIEAMQTVLQGYGFSFFDLTECSPKAEKTKAACARAVCTLLADETQLAHMRRTHTLPVAEIQKTCGVPRKILERHRRYIIAAAEILDGDDELLKEYLKRISDTCRLMREERGRV